MDRLTRKVGRVANLPLGCGGYFCHNLTTWEAFARQDARNDRGIDPGACRKLGGVKALSGKVVRKSHGGTCATRHKTCQASKSGMYRVAVDFADGEPHDAEMGKIPAKVPNAALRAARKRSGLTLERAADAIGISHSQLSRIETGDRQPKAVELQKLAEIYGATVEEIMPGAPLIESQTRYQPKPSRASDDILSVAIFETLIAIGVKPEMASRFVAMIEQVVLSNPPGYPGLTPAETTRLIVRQLAAGILATPPD